MIGTVDANEVIVSSRIPGRIQTLTVEEGQRVQAGQLIATIESQDLEAARAAADATAASARYKLLGSRDTERQTADQTSSQVTNAEAQLRVAQASLLQAQAQYDHQEADTRRTAALAQQGVMSAQARDEAETSLNAYKAAVDGARDTVAAAQASLQVALANTNQAKAATQTAAANREEMNNARALLDQAKVELGYAQVLSPVTGIVDVRAARQGEVVSAGTPIVTVVDLTQTWVYAPLPRPKPMPFSSGTRLRVVMPSGATTQGKVIAKTGRGGFCHAARRQPPQARYQDGATEASDRQSGNELCAGNDRRSLLPKSKLVKR